MPLTFYKVYQLNPTSQATYSPVQVYPCKRWQLRDSQGKARKPGAPLKAETMTSFVLQGLSPKILL